jgi:hypothetical protein
MKAIDSEDELALTLNITSTNLGYILWTHA